MAGEADVQKIMKSEDPYFERTHSKYYLNALLVLIWRVG